MGAGTATSSTRTETDHHARDHRLCRHRHRGPHRRQLRRALPVLALAAAACRPRRGLDQVRPAPLPPIARAAPADSPPAARTNPGTRPAVPPERVEPVAEPAGPPAGEIVCVAGEPAVDSLSLPIDAQRRVEVIDVELGPLAVAPDLI